MIINSEEDRKYITDILATDPDAELRDCVSKQPNGEYASTICGKCKSFVTIPNGNVATAKIVDVCRECVSKKQVVDIEVNAPAFIVNSVEQALEMLNKACSFDGDGYPLFRVSDAIIVLQGSLGTAKEFVNYLNLLQKNGDRVSLGWTEFLDQLKGKR